MIVWVGSCDHVGGRCVPQPDSPDHCRWTVGLSAGFGGVYGFANFIVFIAYAVTFRFAAYLLTLPVDHTLYANFEDIFTVFLAVILGSLAAGQASPALTLTSQALSAATAVLGVMESPEQAEMEEGEKKPPVSHFF